VSTYKIGQDLGTSNLTDFNLKLLEVF